MGTETTAKARRKVRQQVQQMEGRDQWGEVAAGVMASVTGDAAARNAAMTSATVRLAVTHVVVCGCGNILDSRTAMVVEDASERLIGIFCKTCAPAASEQAHAASARLGEKGVEPGTVVARLLYGSGRTVAVAVREHRPS